MGKYEKLLQKILSGRQDQSIPFSELTHLLSSLGFSGRIKGSHHLFFRSDIAEIINIQPIDNKAKAYQVNQIRNLIIKYKLEEKDA
jgi:predicted RNA binding protein YcfA (HicA-like mRNA interferase family)